VKRLRRCLSCRHPLKEGERQQNGIHVVCLWASTVGHEFGFCDCTGYDDCYAAGLAYFIREGLPLMEPPR
jgi:hypothetical protein